MWRFDEQKVPNIRVDPPGPVAQEWLRRDAQQVSPSYTRVYPLVVERASGCVVQDVDGNLYLDCTAGIAVTATGHCHPQVVAAIQQQAERLVHMSGTDFYYPLQVKLAERLAQLVPGPSPKRVFFANSGAEAIEGALKLARWYTRRPRVISFVGAFHGRTYGAMSLSTSKAVHRRGFAPLLPEVYQVAFPRVCPEGGRCQQQVCRLIDELETGLFRRIAPADEVAAIFVEPIQGEGGYYPLPPGCLPALRTLCDRYGIVLVVDEVQTGMGRTGRMFAVEHYGIEPDILCLAKGIASGLPLAAIVARAPIMNWPPGSHASTFGGNPVCCAAALATLDLLENGYITNAAERGEQLRRGLSQLCRRYPCLSGVRGLGLMTAVDLPTASLRDQLLQLCFRRGLLLLGCGEAALRFCPPLCITASQIETALHILADALAHLPVA
jgi:4-aminobutyrate aminotransferase